MDYRLRRHDGEYRWVFYRGVPFTNDDGEFGGYIGSCIDVTPRVAAEAELEQRRQEELDRVQKLLPVRAWCGKIRNDEGYWQAVHSYVQDQGLDQASHGICESCLDGMNQ